MQPFLDTTLLFLGLPFVVTRTNRNPFIVDRPVPGRRDGVHARRARLPIARLQRLARAAARRLAAADDLRPARRRHERHAAAVERLQQWSRVAAE